MIGDKLTLQPKHLIPAKEIYNHLSDKIKGKYTIAIGGESGCGKSTLAVAIKEIFGKEGLNIFIFHMDDYFLLPPTSNHNQRLWSLTHVGPQEVNLELLQKHIDAFKNKNHTITKPLVHYKENEIRSEQIDLTHYDIILIEGTYTLSLDVDTKIFMERNYKDTLQDRINRARDPLTPFVESVLEIEHNIISRYIDNANIIVNKDYSIKFCK
jgi:uridine kinase